MLPKILYSVLVFHGLENIVGKGEIAGYQPFLLFLKGSSRLFPQNSSLPDKRLTKQWAMWLENEI